MVLKLKGPSVSSSELETVADNGVGIEACVVETAAARAAFVRAEEALDAALRDARGEVKTRAAAMDSANWWYDAKTPKAKGANCDKEITSIFEINFRTF